ncbi:MAG TPA: hypothetical protein VG847_16170 [Chitinophagaceae bacterium]|nr:hypothetical protein [Chitinophagaceae bacterium]
MKPFIVLIIAFTVSLLILFLVRHQWNYILAGNIAMCVMLCFTSIAHFAFKKGMAMMIPGFIPFKNALVFVTGIFEIIAGIGLLFTNYRTITAWSLIIFFLLMLPANIHAAIKKVDYQKGNFEGSGINYLWFRIPLQIFFIAWVYFFSVK